VEALAYHALGHSVTPFARHTPEDSRPREGLSGGRPRRGSPMILPRRRLPTACRGGTPFLGARRGSDLSPVSDVVSSGRRPPTSQPRHGRSSYRARGTPVKDVAYHAPRDACSCGRAAARVGRDVGARPAGR
jgi:hypothetical protein